ncbi:hypothetical protein Vi05172_g11801 [Venturia inaequalis]|nr:hypothetical protein Vi05172_g11801 [Venturia inaequalis]
MLTVAKTSIIRQMRAWDKPDKMTETFHTNYQPRNAGVDGQATFLGDERRDAVNDAFRELTLPRNPNLWHSLPAAKQHKIESRQDWLDPEEKMAT